MQSSAIFKGLSGSAVVLLGLLVMATSARSAEIPTVQTCNVLKGYAKEAKVEISERGPSGGAGGFVVTAEFGCEPDHGGIVGSSFLRVTNIRLSDSGIGPAFISKSIHQVTAYGSAKPTAILTGLCDYHQTPCRYWMLFMDGGDPRRQYDAIGLFVTDMRGHRLAHGFGPVMSGEVKVRAEDRGGQSQVQVPPLQVCGTTGANGRGLASSEVRGEFEFKLSVQCNESTRWVPRGNLDITMNLTDSSIRKIHSTEVLQMTSGGKHTPMAFLSGRCESDRGPCSYWAVIADNTLEVRSRHTLDIISFLVLSPQGQRLSYATGFVKEGGVSVAHAP